MTVSCNYQSQNQGVRVSVYHNGAKAWLNSQAPFNSPGQKSADIAGRSGQIMEVLLSSTANYAFTQALAHAFGKLSANVSLRHNAHSLALLLTILHSDRGVMAEYLPKRMATKKHGCKKSNYKCACQL